MIPSSDKQEDQWPEIMTKALMGFDYLEGMDTHNQAQAKSKRYTMAYAQKTRDWRASGQGDATSRRLTT